MIMAGGARNGWIDCERAMMESLTSIGPRLGADFVLTYFAKARGTAVRVVLAFPPALPCAKPYRSPRTRASASPALWPPC